MSDPIRMVSVPVEPTNEMLEAGILAAWPGPEIVYADEHAGPEFMLSAAFKAMLTAAPDALRVAVTDIAAERQRQVDVEGWSEAHDDEHDGYQMARAAGCYAFHASREDDDGDTGMFVSAAVHHGWPWDRAWWKPKSRRADLVRAGALIVAEIERLDRAALQAEQGAK